jgi:hypothetical protein
MRTLTSEINPATADVVVDVTVATSRMFTGVVFDKVVVPGAS